MMISSNTRNRVDTMNWRGIKHWVVLCLMVAGSFSAGNWFRSVKDQEGKLPVIEKAAAEDSNAKIEAGCEQRLSHAIQKKLDELGMVAKEDVPKDNCPHLDPKQ